MMGEDKLVERHWPNGKLHIRFTMRGKLMHGKEQNWTDSGQLWLERNWENGEIRSLKMWREGKLIHEVTYGENNAV